MLCKLYEVVVWIYGETNWIFNHKVHGTGEEKGYGKNRVHDNWSTNYNCNEWEGGGSWSGPRILRVLCTKSCYSQNPSQKENEKGKGVCEKKTQNNYYYDGNPLLLVKYNRSQIKNITSTNQLLHETFIELLWVCFSIRPRTGQWTIYQDNQWTVSRQKKERQWVAHNTFAF